LQSGIHRLAACGAVQAGCNSQDFASALIVPFVVLKATHFMAGCSSVAVRVEFGQPFDPGVLPSRSAWNLQARQQWL
jgi:hypothetical protein